MISVIIPTYKTTHALDLCLESAIKGQQNKNQIIVVVDGHYDLNKEVLEKYSEHIDILDLVENVGACKALNLGVYNAQYDKILMVNDDNVFPQHWDTILEEEWDICSEKYPEGFALTPNQIEPFPSMFKQFIIEDLGRDPKTFDLEKFWLFNYHYASGNKIEENGSTWPILMNKYDYLKVGGFAEDYPSQSGFVTDWEFFMKCQMSGLKMIRTWNCHFYHFVALSNKAPEQLMQSKQEESDCHEYAKYKWGNYIYHNQETNLKFIKN
jgi:glycosyltransferase involved in cell wall biosynthesis